ncbi:MAG TPA: histidine phosphatase family protein [Parachlamydiaceae bacterium]|nr:histidine phosphatase family protein [Parachlamydiaceae bacterium]
MVKDICNFYIVRHGQTDWNKIKKMQGYTDIPLNDEGRNQALSLKEHFKGVHFDAIYASDLLRAKQSAEILSHGRNLDIATTSKLRERYWGQHEGKTVEELRLKYGAFFEPMIEEFKPNKSLLHPDLQSVESYFDALIGRVFPFLEELKNRFLGKSVLAVSHGGILKAFLLFLNSKEFSKPYVDNMAYLHLELSQKEISLKAFKGVQNHSPIN